MIDPLTALGLVGNILAFAEAGLKIVRSSYQFYRSKEDAHQELLDLQVYAGHVMAMSDKIDTATSVRSSTSSDLSALQKCAKTSKELNGELSSLFQNLKIDPKPTIWKAIGCACRTLYHSSKLRDVKGRLETLRQIATDCMIGDIR